MKKRPGRNLAHIQLQLERSQISEWQPGFIPNQWGSFWNEGLVQEWLDTNEQFCRVGDLDESRAARYSKAMFLLSLNRLDEAEVELSELVAACPIAPYLRGLAIVAARGGNMQRAAEIAQAIGSAPDAEFFAISEDDLRREAAIGAKMKKGTEP